MNFNEISIQEAASNQQKHIFCTMKKKITFVLYFFITLFISSASHFLCMILLDVEMVFTKRSNVLKMSLEC